MKREQTGNEDQRYITRDDHDAARRWFEKKARAQDKRWSRNDRRDNLKKLRETFERLDLKTK